jgi:glutamate carboxypeptidase
VTPTLAGAGIATNVVPPSAWLEVDVRATSAAEQARVDGQMRALAPSRDGATVSVAGGINRPPLEESRSRELFARARAIAQEHGLGELHGVAVGGGSDGNFSAALGTPTLDGLGPVGEGAHSADEQVVISQMPHRAALLALLIDDLLSRGT